MKHISSIWEHLSGAENSVGGWAVRTPVCLLTRWRKEEEKAPSLPLVRKTNAAPAAAGDSSQLSVSMCSAAREGRPVCSSAV